MLTLPIRPICHTNFLAQISSRHDILLPTETVQPTALCILLTDILPGKNFWGPIYEISYDNAKVTIDLQRKTNLQNISRRTLGFSWVRFAYKIIRSSEIVFIVYYIPKRSLSSIVARTNLAVILLHSFHYVQSQPIRVCLVKTWSLTVTARKPINAFASHQYSTWLPVICGFFSR